MSAMDLLAKYVMYMISDIIVGVCTFAISYMLRDTDGPWDIFYKLRKCCGLYIDEQVVNDVTIDGKTYFHFEEIEDPSPEGFFAKLFSCFWCLATWISLFVSIGYILVVSHDAKTFPFLWISGIGLAGFMYMSIIDEN